MKTSKVKAITFKKEWMGKDGSPVYTHVIELENGDKGEVNFKSKFPHQAIVGNEYSYSIEPNANPNWASKIPTEKNDKSAYGGQGTKQNPKISAASYALSYSKDLVVGGVIPLDKLTQQADVLFNWLNSKL
jgi:hypothetical protein